MGDSLNSITADSQCIAIVVLAIIIWARLLRLLLINRSPAASTFSFN